QLVTDLLELQQQRNAMVSEGQTKNPVLRMTEEKIKEVQQAITTSVDNLIASNGLIQKDLNTRIAALDEQVRLLPQSERTLVDIQRLLTLSENLYIFLMEKRAEAAITRSSNTPDVKVVEPAMQLDQPIYPNRKLAYFIALVLGVLVPFLIIFLRDRFDDRITDKDQLMSLTSIPFLGMVPHLTDLNPIAVFSRPKSSVAEAFRILRSNINFFGGEENGSRVMLITSSIAEEGKTFCAVNLATVIAMSGKKTVILGLDLRKPKLHSNFNLPNDIGLSNYLASGNGVHLSDIVLATNIPNLDFIPSGPTPPNPAELLMSERIGNLIEKLKEDYDFVILDTPPTGLVTDAFILKQHSDLNIYITRQGHTRRLMVRNTDELYRQKRFQDICILLNDVRSSYGYNYGYGYGYGYGYYEENKVDFWTRTFQKMGIKRG
ncbi:MAG: polysaccharide biosynthesis tyrosine autokinase, partial [Bacteroidota bacterium]